MNRWTCAAVTLAGVVAGLATAASAQSAAEEQAIRALIESHAVAWNRRDIKAASDVYANNATIISGGRSYTGRGGVEQRHTEALAAPNPTTHTHPPETIQVHFLGPDVAVADVESHTPDSAAPGVVRAWLVFSLSW